MIKDLTGNRFGRLIVVGYAGSSKNFKAQWLCRCDCGNEKVVLSGCLLNSDTRSCGCLNVERITKHGNAHHRLYQTWQDVKQRCLNPNNSNFHNYGGRGIGIAQEWMDFATFLNWAKANGYRDDLTLERVNNDGDYCPENCTFITRSDQQSNKRSNHSIQYKGETGTLTYFANKYGLNRNTVYGRIRTGWSAKDAFEIPIAHKRYAELRKEVLNNEK